MKHPLLKALERRSREPHIAGPWLSTADAAATLRIAPKTLRRLRQRGLVTPIRAGSHFRWSLPELVEALRDDPAS